MNRNFLSICVAAALFATVNAGCNRDAMPPKRMAPEKHGNTRIRTRAMRATPRS